MDSVAWLDLIINSCFDLELLDDHFHFGIHLSCSSSKVVALLRFLLALANFSFYVCKLNLRPFL